MVAAGQLERVARGLYCLSGAATSAHRDLAIVARRTPSGVLCLLTALRFHGLTTQNPFQVWLAVGHKARPPTSDHPPVRVIRMAEPRLREGVEHHSIDGVHVAVFSAAKTIADCFKYRNKIGIDVALEAFRDYRRRHPKQLDEVWRFAVAARVARVLRPYLESLT